MPSASDDRQPAVTHAMFDQESGVLPCCGLHRYEVVQTDRVSIHPSQKVTCDGTKRRETLTKGPYLL